VNTTKKRFANARDGYIGSARHFVQELEMAEARRPGEAYDSVGIFYTLVVSGFPAVTKARTQPMDGEVGARFPHADVSAKLDQWSGPGLPASANMAPFLG
jgi:hypothetical protein